MAARILDGIAEHWYIAAFRMTFEHNSPSQLKTSRT
jgi:hypothetical protein